MKMVPFAVLTLGLALVAAAPRAVADQGDLAPKKSPAPAASAASTEESPNYFRLGVGGAFVDGPKPAFQQRTGQRSGASGGVEAFHYEENLSNKSLFEMDGRGVFENHDYLLDLKLSKPDLGYINSGYKEFRTWYNGTGGFFPQGGQWFVLNDPELAVDRGEAWFEAALTLPDLPVFKFRYSHEYRNGRKDSTSWGDSTATGGFGTRNIVPSFLDLNEQRDSFAGDMTHTLDTTAFGVGLRYELLDNNDSRNIDRRPTESADRSVTSRDIIQADTFSVHGFTETDVTEKTLFTTGCAYTTMDSDIGGHRIYGPGYDAAYSAVYPGRQGFDEGFLDLTGGSKLHQYVANVSAMNTSIEDVYLVAALRAERETVDSVNSQQQVSATGAAATSRMELANTDERSTKSAQSLQARYTGFQDWVLYAEALWEEENGNAYVNNLNASTNALIERADRLFDTFRQKYTIGDNWYPAKGINLATQYYHSIHANSYVNRNDFEDNNSADAYPGFIKEQDFETDDVNFRVTWKPLHNLTAVSRYDYQLSTIDTQGDRTTALGYSLDKIQSSSEESHMFGESITWSPITRLYVQGNFNYVLNTLNTPAPDYAPVANAILPSQNNYWNASLMSGYALDKKSDLQLQYTYYRADNYRDDSTAGMPYGAGAEEQSVTLGYNRKLTDTIRWDIKYGYMVSHDQTSGGMNDYIAHMLYSGVNVSF